MRTITEFWLDKIKAEWQAEAVATERARIAEAVRGLWCHEWPDEPESRVVIASYNSALGAVLALAQPEAER